MSTAIGNDTPSQPSDFNKLASVVSGATLKASCRPRLMRERDSCPEARWVAMSERMLV